MKPFECKEPHHVCGDRCHPSKQHIACDFHCAKALKCGHPCLNLCTERCNCYETVEQPLRCSHEEVLGLDRETAMPIYATVHHSFRGVCEDVHLPCHVEYESECALCLGPLRVKCFEAVENLHTPSNRTLVCLSCKRAEREMRANLLGDVLITTEKKKETLRKDLQKSIHHQQKAAAHGLYTPGARVEITDPPDASRLSSTMTFPAFNLWTSTTPPCCCGWRGRMAPLSGVTSM
ncbi:hypothetical protein AGDE_15560 [Angomonas deanei]|nr:hypothetical protein AGDE_15560 [Angomonas deanei]|eukprot:EPY18854.1 hypothetical protein AGDE_15560 [Angomonas deanei]